MKKIIGSLSLVVCLGIGTAMLNTGCESDSSHRTAGTYIDDKTIETKVKSALLADPEVKGMAINVEVNDARVQLAGFVDTLSQKNRAGELARNTHGVKYVQNNLAIK